MIILSDSYKRYQANFSESEIPIACRDSFCTRLTHPRFTYTFSLFESVWANLLVELFMEEVGKM